MLALGASDLSARGTDLDFSTQALSHRVKAISLLNPRLCEPVLSAADCDALFAAVICLTTQTFFLEDALIEFVTMLRGCNLVASSIKPRFEGESTFKDFTPEGHAGRMQRVIGEQGEPPKNERLIASFEASVLRVGPLCRRSTEIGYFNALHDLVQMVKASSAGGRF